MRRNGFHVGADDASFFVRRFAREEGSKVRDALDDTWLVVFLFHFIVMNTLCVTVTAESCPRELTIVQSLLLPAIGATGGLPRALRLHLPLRLFTDTST